MECDIALLALVGNMTLLVSSAVSRYISNDSDSGPDLFIRILYAFYYLYSLFST